MVYIGVDLHRKHSQVVAIDDQGEVVYQRRVASSPGEVFRVFGELEAEPMEVAFEATFGWGWFADMLADAGIPAHMGHPLATKAIANARVKNDSVDARTLAQLLRANLLPEAWIAPAPVRNARRLVRMRASLVRVRSRLKCQIHAVLGDHGVLPAASDLFGAGGHRQLAKLRLPPLVRHRVEANLRLISDLDAEIEIAELEVHKLFAKDARVKRLLPIPGVGLTTAATILAEIGDVSRFASPKQLCAWGGLTPTERSSADHTRRGHISKQGSRWLRWILVEAAIHALSNPSIRQWYLAIAERRGDKIARVAVARRLLTLVYYALRDEQGCRAFPVPSAPGRARSSYVMASR